MATRVHSDCKGAVELANAAPSIQVHRKHLYAGVRKFALNLPTAGLMVEAVHTPAHRSMLAIDALAPNQRRVALANRHVDEAAKQALAMHPQLPPAAAAEVDLTVQKARAVVRLMAAVLPLFPHQRWERAP